MPPLEVWQKVLVSRDFFSTTHGQMKCTFCHGGNDKAAERSAAHEGLIADASVGSAEKCAACHPDQMKKFADSLHRSNKGIVDLKEGVLAPRVDPARLDVAATAVNNHCASCHIQRCGDCHVSRPQWAGGGFVNGHTFSRKPKPVLNCTACHGSGVEKEMIAKGP